MSALIAKFRNEASKANGFAKYTAGMEPVLFENFNSKSYKLDRFDNFTKCVESIFLEEAIAQSAKTSNRRILMVFKEEYLGFYLRYIKNLVPRAGDPNPDNLVC